MKKLCTLLILCASASFSLGFLVRRATPRPIIPVIGPLDAKTVEFVIAEFRERASVTKEIMNEATNENVRQFYSGLSAGYTASANFIEESARIGWKYQAIDPRREK